MQHQPSHAWIVVVDLVGYSSHSDPLQASMLVALDKLVQTAVADSGLDWAELDVKDRGDGMILKVPATVPPVRIVGDLIRTLDSGLTEMADIYASGHRIRLRVALHQGLAAGYAGQAVNFACHLVDSDVLRETIGRAPAANLGLIVSDAFYREVIKPGHRLVDPATFASALVDIKNEPGSIVWLYVPGYPSPPLPGTSASTRNPGDADGPIRPGASRSRSSRAAAAPAGEPQSVTYNFGGDRVSGDKNEYGDSTYHQSFGARRE